MRVGAKIQTALVVSAVVYSATLLFMWLSFARDDPLGKSRPQTAPWHLEHEARRLRHDLSVSQPMSATGYPRQMWESHDFECLRWVGTDDEGEPTGDIRECWHRVRGGEAGYCEVRNRSGGDVFHVMHTTSLSLKEEVRFTCRYAERFTNFRHLARGYRHDPPMPSSIDGKYKAGIIMAVHEGVLISAYASIRQLRAVGCALPVELWSRWDEVQHTHPIIRKLIQAYGPIRLRRVHDDRVHGFYIKIHAVYYSAFRNVLLLDADNFALRDPTTLFSSSPFRRYGAVFWPDFWHPGNTIFNIHAQSLLWELLGMDYVDMMEQESGQVLIDRERSREALERLMFFGTQRPNILNKLLVVWGDKDLFRLAWLHVGQPFFFNTRRLPGSIGMINSDRQRFCGMSMVQYDVNGHDMLFLHRNTVKLRAGVAQPRLWHTLQEYALDATPPPTIQSFNGRSLFNTTSCFGVKRYDNQQISQVVTTRDVNSITILAGLEDKLIAFAIEATQLLLAVEGEVY